MLVLTRRKGQRTFLRCACGLTTVEVLEVIAFGRDGPKVRLGFDAPAGTVIVREEVERRAVNTEDDAA